jgi:radical SAM protein with 4Fe4S-binding SPASM domain
MVKSLSNTQLHFYLEQSRYNRQVIRSNLSKKAIDFPIEIQIQTINACNGSCLMCPISQIKKQKIEHMSEKLFEKIIKEISQENSKLRYIDLYLQNEPLMDKDIFKKISFIKKNGGKKISTVIVSNGSLFDDEKINELENSDLDLLIISLDAFTEKTYNKIRQGLDFKKVLSNIDKILNSKYKNYFFVGFVKQKDNINEFMDFKKYWEKKGVYTWIFNITNRTGDLENYEDFTIKKIDESFLKKSRDSFVKKLIKCCPIPLTSFNILSNGDAILCCDDYSKKITLGNVKESSIKEIWNSNKYKNIRENFFRGDFKKINVCSNCSSWESLTL